MRTVFVLMLVGCGGGTKAAEPGGVGSQASPDCAAGELVIENTCKPSLTTDTLDALAAQLSTVAKQLAATEPLEQASQALTAVHQLDQWKRAAAKLQVIDLAGAEVTTRALGEKFETAAQELRALHADLAAIGKEPRRRTLAEVREMVSTRIAAVVAPLGVAVGEAVPLLYTHYEDPLFEEIIFINEHLCAKAEPALVDACKHTAATAAHDYLDAARGAARHQFDDVFVQLERELAKLLDVRATTAIDRATDRGPTYGQPCGPEDLCEWRLTCAPTHTCEAWCREMAEQPCPGGTHCTTVAGLDRQVCRPNH